MTFKMFEGLCPECKKEKVFLAYPDDVRFCSKLCETNYNYRMNHVDPITGKVPTPEETRTYGAKRDLPKDTEKD